MAASEPAANPAEVAYRAGDYRTARRLSRGAAADESRPATERERARRILRATGIDPLAIAAFLLTTGVIGYLIVRHLT